MLVYRSLLKVHWGDWGGVGAGLGYGRVMAGSVGGQVQLPAFGSALQVAPSVDPISLSSHHHSLQYSSLTLHLALRSQPHPFQTPKYTPMSSFSSSTSGSTFGGRSSGSEDGMSFGSPTKHDLEGGHHLEPLNEEAKDENEPLDHPVLSSFNRDTVVSNEFVSPRLAHLSFSFSFRQPPCPC